MKSFHADTMTEAMAQVRAVLGENAIIISTREDKENRSFRVTAAIEEFEPEPVLDFGEDEWEYGLEEASDPVGDTPFDDEIDFESDDFDDFEPQRPERSLTTEKANVINSDEESYFESAFSIADMKAEDEDVDFFDFELEEDEEGGFHEQGFIEPITESLIRHNFPASLTDRIISSAIASNLGDAAPAFVAALEKIYKFTSIPMKRHAKPFIFVGAPGSGKTLCVAKLAAKASMAGLKVAVITTDTVRAGGVEQLKAFTRLLDIDLMTADDPAALNECIKMHPNADLVFIDTPGISPFNPRDMKTLVSFLKVSDFEPVLVLPAGSDANESADMARAFEIIGVKHLMPTRLDISRRYGGVMAAAYAAQMTFTDASNSAQVAEGLISLTPQTMAKVLVPDFFNKKEHNS